MKIETERRGHKFILDEATRSHIEEASKWLIGVNDKPGIMLRGYVGNGKTTMMRAMILVISFITELNGYNNRVVVPIYTARRIAALCAEKETRVEYRKLIGLPILAIDDLGEEPGEIINYGMVYEPLKDMLLERYDKQLATIVTTNLQKDKLIEKYSERVYDRFREMMGVINFKNASYRK